MKKHTLIKVALSPKKLFGAAVQSKVTNVMGNLAKPFTGTGKLIENFKNKKKGYAGDFDNFWHHLHQNVKTETKKSGKQSNSLFGGAIKRLKTNIKDSWSK